MSAPARRDQILDTAMDLVVEQGFQAVSILSIANEAGITRPIVYEHFGNLHGVLEALIKREMARAVEQVSTSALSDLAGGDPSELLLASLRTYLSAVAASPSTWRLVLTPPEGAPELLRKSIVRGRAEVLSSMTAAVSPGSLPGDLSDDPELTARILSAMADEYARLVLSDPKRFAPARLIEHARWWLSQIPAVGQ